MGVPSGSDPSSLYGSPLVTLPYCTTATFKAFPSYAVLDNLVVGVINAASNTAELNNLLIQASQRATDAANMPLHGHVRVENKILRVGRNGLLSWHAASTPVRLVTGLSYAWDLNGSSTSVTDLSRQWIQEDAQVNIPFAPFSTSLNGLQFGPPVSSSPLYTSWTYTAGAAHALLAITANAGAMSIVVTDPTAIMPGDRLRIWDSGTEESVTVAASYGIGSTTVPLNSALVNTHTVGTSPIAVSAIPSTIQLAVVLYTCALLLRPDSSAEDQYPDVRTGITTRSEDARRDGSGLAAEAYRLVRSYMRVR